MDSVYLSIVVPCYNESENLKAGVLQEMSDYLARRAFRYEVIIADDGSADDSRELIRGQLPNLPGFSLQENPPRRQAGCPCGTVSRLLPARSCSLPTWTSPPPLNQIERLLPLFDAGCDVVIGSRGMERANFPLYRRIGSQLFRGFRRLFILRDISDTQCGFKAMRLAVAQEIFPRLEPIRRQGPVSGWKVTAFDVELLFLAERAGYRLGEVQVSWANRDRSSGQAQELSGGITRDGLPGAARQAQRLAWLLRSPDRLAALPSVNPTPRIDAHPGHSYTRNIVVHRIVTYLPARPTPSVFVGGLSNSCPCVPTRS